MDISNEAKSSTTSMDLSSEGGRYGNVLTDMIVRDIILRAVEREHYGIRFNKTNKQTNKQTNKIKAFDALDDNIGESERKNDHNKCRIYVWNCRESSHIPFEIQELSNELNQKRNSIHKMIRSCGEFTRKYEQCVSCVLFCLKIYEFVNKINK
ncbi:hypothetical protein RFI_11572 [Reticulomyxa filosa]|uniref:Uncharacterized protein n=1 Tax=Reticulomyxa filosa TaxID=46433 RepID=X6NGX0_RETFI|nr:hypothetical protein RFI_11572 [Reticulomyxa filosa]|eukprot:ETO25565.1 hypothetical protein RFI_11572 [Reticulomyxa filosa]